MASVSKIVVCLWTLSVVEPSRDGDLAALEVVLAVVGTPRPHLRDQWVLAEDLRHQLDQALEVGSVADSAVDQEAADSEAEEASAAEIEVALAEDEEVLATRAEEALVEGEVGMAADRPTATAHHRQMHLRDQVVEEALGAGTVVHLSMEAA